MLQKEIIDKLKKGAQIAVYHRNGKRLVYLNCNIYAKYPDRMRQYMLDYRQFQSLYQKGIIEERYEQRKTSKDDISAFYYYAEV